MIKLLVPLLIGATLSFSQNLNFKFENLSTKDGLSQNTITAILQDHEGYLWFGTQNGLNRYDGYSFKIYNNILNTNDKFNSYNITSIAQDFNGKIWIGTASNGISVFDTKRNKFYVLDLDEEAAKSISFILPNNANGVWVATEGAGLKEYSLDYDLINSYKSKNGDINALSSNRISTLFQDKQGNLWIGTKDVGLNFLNRATKKISRIKLLNNNTSVTSINRDEKGLIWIGTALEGIIILDPETRAITTYKNNPFDKNSLAQNSVNCIYKDSKNKFWIGTGGGLSIFDPEKNKFSTFHHNPKKPSSLSSDRIFNVFEDRSGIFWLGTSNNGINRFSRAYSVFNNYYQEPNDNNSLNADEIWSINEIENGKLWIGTNNGISYWDLQNNLFKHYIANAYAGAINHNVVRTIHEYKNGKLLIGTNGGGLNIFDPKNGQCQYLTFEKGKDKLSDNFIRDIVQGSEGTYWIATMGGLNHFYPEKGSFKSYKNIAGDNTSISDNRILDIYVDKTGILWLATYNGLSKFDPKKEIFTNYNYDPKDSQSISNNLVISIYESEKSPGILWIGTSAGLNKLNIESGKFSRFFQDEKLANNVIYSITEDENNFLWLGTNKGISRFDQKNFTFKNFGTKDGIHNAEFNAGSVFKLSDGRLFFGGVKGITGFLPSEIKQNKKVPNIVITSFKKYDKTFPIDSLLAFNETLYLTYEDKYISFDFAALDFTNSDKNQYKYMLEGFDTEWIESGSRRYASYTNLDGGEYIFHVKGSNNDGVWNNEGAKLKIIIKAPIWETLWFQTFSGFLTILLLFSFYKTRVARIQRQREILKTEVRASIKELIGKNLDLKYAQNEKDRILQNVEEGLFLMNDKRIIQSQYSSALLKILQTESPSGKNFLKCIAAYLPEKHVNLTKEYLELIFDPEIDEDLILGLNPLQKLEFHFQKIENGQPFSKYLTFRFKRILNGRKISGLIITVLDETKEHILAQKLIDTKAKSKKQIEWLMGILHLDPKLLYEFLTTTNAELALVDSLLQNETPKDNYLNILEQIARSLHLLKGNANLLELNFFAQQVHELENRVFDISSKANSISGTDFLPLVMGLSDLKNNLNELEKLIGRLVKFNTQNHEKHLTENQSLVHLIENLVKRLAHDLNKKARFDYTNFKGELIPPQYSLLLKDILIHLVRNSIVHGIETPQERKDQLKPEEGTISISNNTNNDSFTITFRDDGRGLQLEKLKESALESNLWAENEIQSWNKDQIAKVIFTQGISSADETDLISGRGVGMDLLKDQLKKYNGKIEVKFSESEFCEFKITLPLIHTN